MPSPLPYMMQGGLQHQEFDPDVITPGTIIVPVRDDLARYNQFGFSLAALAKPVGTRLVVSTGLNIVASLNDSIEKDFAGEWLMLLGDDHVLPQQLIPKLLATGKDVIAPLTFTRRAPFHWCVFKKPGGDPEAGGWELYQDDELPPSGVAAVGAVGNAGMLIRAPVIAALLEWRGYCFSNSTAKAVNEDLEFCGAVAQIPQEIAEKHGLEWPVRVWVDLDLRLGHLGTFFTVPHFDTDSGWGVAIEFPGGFGRIFLPGTDHRRVFAELQQEAEREERERAQAELLEEAV